MSGFSIALLGFGAMLLLIAARMPIALAMLVVGAAGYAWLSSPHALIYYLQTNAYSQFASYTLSVIPLFVLMGALAERSGIAATLLRAAEHSLGRLRGGMPMAVIAACAGFGAICGSSVATTATFGRAALPELRRANVNPGFGTGTIAAGGTLGILIPPSVILVIYAITAEQNIAKLFQAALIPGLIAVAFYIVAIAVAVRRNPELAPPIEFAPPAATPRPAWARPAGAVLVLLAAGAWLAGYLGAVGGVLLAILGLLMVLADFAVVPAAAIAVVVVGGIYGQVFTPTEGAAVGAAIMLAVGIAQRRLDLEDIRHSFLQTAETTGMIFLILLGAEVFGAFLALTQMPMTLASMIGESSLPPYAVICGMMLAYIVLGAVMDELAMILLTLPVFMPVVLSLDFGMPTEDVAIWFGILVLVVVGIGLTAPPIGLNVFIINKIARDVPIVSTYRGVFPFVIADFVRLVVLLAFPAISLWLVHLLN
ncbi:TRAP transporter large permease [Shinella yambaruensis]|uniref:C4-dicarboxylate ABC transporter permease n=1 Tax=Shinella yambaruensis TaxID=415996 RepID=A0ABQ5ZE36_9HYPH|nr:TRAP transporter large permease [Shinella yambaruensis]MCJ8029667.1 TRAP transporter large permease [Shinella yambaruensis]MCU7984396.1 TRAP transporter large permease [Shinella yambaruensis]GLR50117.1 C4-dicarboxylate ABC transporter permease [Shinella yambaruensis]